MDGLTRPPALRAKDFKSSTRPVWCPGCGHFGVMTGLVKALAGLELAPEMVALISGIGCSSRIPTYTRLYGFHGVHGRALALATGLKAARPDITVVAAGGDGDGFSIGGNHFLHACRRNINITYIVMDNEVYGMTKGQASPTTPADWTASKLTPKGTGMRPFQPVAIALAAGATFVARSFSGKSNDLARVIAAGIQHQGFSFIQVLSPCPTYQPEQLEWKHVVRPFGSVQLPTSDPAIAAEICQRDDGMSTGVIFQADRPAWRPPVERTAASLIDIESEFEL